ncbi:HAMP domain-containing histidine kinase [Trichlorobacter lovleyi]|uniref:sensor histidine kinase n=1 Tax=Trichlorobacter lovleyi TaxID=313985 RepID=UPI0022403C5C|nr:HAMP domain-containing sensor histidine kinase [Trichlorobacter lovleyi]QOX79934.1 HAMP domain-containing histidine kinase [Trichlorobacter lovleyi]
MPFNLQRKLLVLLGLVILIALSSSILLRNFVIRDFKAFGEGRMLDRLYQVQAVLEGRYEQSGGWQQDQVANDLVWAWLSGIELRLYDVDNRLVMDTGQALASLSPVMQQRIAASSSRRPLPPETSEFQSYPLFLRGEEIGHLDLQLPHPIYEAFFIRSSNQFLIYSLLGLGLTAVILSFLAARRISRPLQELTAAAEGLASGAPGPRVRAEGNDEIGRLAAAFNRMADSLEAQEQLRKQLVSNAAHELRTPLMIIRGELEGMIDGLLPTTPEALQSLHDEATRLATILDGVDELSRAQAAGLQLQRQEFLLLPLLQGIISRFSRSAEEQQVTITLTGDQTVSAWIDPDRFTQIITNLISNALKAMPHGGRLEIHLSATPQARYIEVSDSGSGIPAELLPHVFERFAKGRDGGLGLGLAIVKELVAAHNGTIAASSSPGNGTCFSITLPATTGGLHEHDRRTD